MSDPTFSIQAEFIPASVEAVFDAFNNVEGWPRWAVHHIKSAVRKPTAPSRSRRRAGPVCCV